MSQSEETPRCGSCNGTGWLYTSSFDDEGFPCPECVADADPVSEGDW